MFGRLAFLCAGVVLALLAPNEASAQNFKLDRCQNSGSMSELHSDYLGILQGYRAADAAGLPKSAPEAEFAVAFDRARKLDLFVLKYEERAKNAWAGLEAAGRLALEVNEDRDLPMTALDGNDLRAISEMQTKIQARLKANRDRRERAIAQVVELHAALCRAQAQRNSPPAGGGTALMMNGDPKPQPKFGGFTVVEDGKVELIDPGYVVVGTWDKLPRSLLDPKGHSIMLALNARGITGPINTGIQIRVTGMEMEVTKAKGVPVKSRDHNQYDLPLTVETGKTGDAHMVILLKPKATYAKGETVTISVGTFYGRKVDYEYKAP